MHPPARSPHLSAAPDSAIRRGLTARRLGNPLTLCDDYRAIFVTAIGRSLWPPRTTSRPARRTLKPARSHQPQCRTFYLALCRELRTSVHTTSNVDTGHPSLSPDAVRKPYVRRRPRAQEGGRTGTVAYQAVVYAPVGNRSACQVRGTGWAAAPSRRHRPARVRVPENGPARSWTARRTSSIGTLAAGGIGNQSLQMRAEWV